MKITKKFIALSLLSLMFEVGVTPIFAQTETLDIADPIAETEINTSVSYDTTCVSNAIVTQANSQMSIVETRQVSMKNASISRRDALASAYLLTDKTARNAAIKSANEAFMATQKTADQTAKSAMETSNQSFKTTLTTCGVKWSMRNGKKGPQKTSLSQNNQGDGTNQADNTESENTQVTKKDTAPQGLFQRIKNYFKF